MKTQTNDPGTRTEVTVPMVMKRWAVVVFGGLILAGCDSVPTVGTFEPITDPAKLFMAVTLDHRAINLSTVAPYDTFRLTAVPRNGLGEPILGLPAPSYTSKDTTRVWVSPDGLIQARGPATGVMVIAEVVTEDNIRHADTAYVNVTNVANPPKLDRLYVDTGSGDKLVWPMIGNGAAGLYLLAALHQIRFDFMTRGDLSSLVRAEDTDGNPVYGLALEYRSSDPRILEISPLYGSVSLWRPGSARATVRTVAYGVERADTVEIVVTPPDVNGFMYDQDGAGKLVPTVNEVVIQTNGVVAWTNTTRNMVEIVFDEPQNVVAVGELCAVLGGEHCTDGNIGLFGHEGEDEPNIFLDLPKYVRARRFPVPGVYPFRITTTGHTGRVVVVDGASQ